MAVLHVVTDALRITNRRSTGTCNKVLDRPIHANLGIGENFNRSVHEEGIILTGCLIVEVWRRTVEAVRIPVVFMLSSSEVGPWYVVGIARGRIFLHA